MLARAGWEPFHCDVTFPSGNRVRVIANDAPVGTKVYCGEDGRLHVKFPCTLPDEAGDVEFRFVPLRCVPL